MLTLSHSGAAWLLEINTLKLGNAELGKSLEKSELDSLTTATELKNINELLSNINVELEEERRLREEERLSSDQVIDDLKYQDFSTQKQCNRI